MVKQIILAFFGSTFPVILFNIDRRKIWWAGLCGVIGWVVNIIIYYKTSSPVIASFFGALAVGVYSELMARILKTPAFEFSIPGIFPLVPGITGYNTLTYILQNNLIKALNMGFQTVAVGGSIGFGIMLSSAAFRFISIIKERKLT